MPKNFRGFTLIELMVAISIVAILAVVGLTVFSNVQKNARDSRRRVDLTAIADALETNKTPGAITYGSLLDTQFASGAVPKDPKTGTQDYCYWGMKATAAGVPNTPLASPSATVVNWTTCARSDVTADDTSVAKTAIPAAATLITSWTICAKLESSATVECRFSKI